MRKHVSIMLPARTLYAFWHDPQQYPRIMDHLEQVHAIDGVRSRWKAKAPANLMLEWESEIVEAVPETRIVWRSVEGAPVRTSGSVHFKRAPGKWGTEVALLLDFAPPGGPIGDWAARALGYGPELMAYRALHRFKCLMETGEIPTTEGQPAARNDGRDVNTRNAETPTPDTASGAAS